MSEVRFGCVEDGGYAALMSIPSLVFEKPDQAFGSGSQGLPPPSLVEERKMWSTSSRRPFCPDQSNAPEQMSRSPC